MGFFDWYLKCIKGHYADFDGRARRTEYWMFYLVNILVFIALAILIGVLQTPSLMILYVIYALATLLPSLAVSVRRMHDLGKSGWWVLIALVPAIGGIWFFVLTVLAGTVGSNQYGADPKAITA